MKIIKSEKEGFTYQLEIEESEEKLMAATDSVFAKAVKKVRVPGFRKGKVPRTIYEKYYGKDSLIRDAVIEVVNKAYVEAINELKLEVVDYPRNLNITEYEENKPVHFSCEVDVKPEVEVGNYIGIKAKKDIEEITDEKVQDKINQMLENHAKFETVERPTESGDILRYNIELSVEGEKLEEWSRQNTGISLGTEYLGKEFDEELVGLSKGDKKDFTIEFKEDFKLADLAGKKVDFNVEILEIREKQLPELDNEMVKKISTFEKADDLRTDIKTKLEEQAKKQSDDKLKKEIIDKIVEQVNVEIPSAMIEREIDSSINYFNETLRRSGSDIEKYLAITGKTIEDMRSSLKENAEKSVITRLVLDQIGKNENLEVTEEELNAEIVNYKIPNVSNVEELLKTVKNVNIDNIKAAIIERKAQDFVVEKAKIA